MDIPFYRNPKEICKTLKTGDNLDPPKNNIKTQSSHNNFDYLSDIVFTTGVIFFIHLGVKTVFNFGSISLKLLTDNFISNYYRSKKKRALENQIKKIFIKPCNERIFELNMNPMSVDSIKLKHQQYILSRQSSDIISTQQTNEFDNDFIEVESEFYFTSNKCPCRWSDIIMMENDIINIVKALYNGEDNIYGNLTTSINNTNLSVCLSYMPINRVGDAKYEIIASTSVHPSFLYIAKVLNIKVNLIDIDNYSGKMLSKKLKSMINYNTLFVIASAPSYSHGIIDNITQLSEVTDKCNIGLHIDCLSDNFILPFLKLNGSIVSNFDFSLKGVTSLSTNLGIDSNITKEMHCILYKKHLAKNQQVVLDSKLHGICPYYNFGSPISGNTIAYYWYYLQFNGLTNFINKSNRIIELKKYLVKELNACNIFSIIGEPFLGKVSIKVDPSMKFPLADKLFNNSWNIEILCNPDALSISIINNFKDESDIDRFIKDLHSVKPIILKKGQSKPIESNIFGIKKIIKNVNHSALLGEIFMETLNYI